MTNEATILACVDPVNAHWQLGPLPPAEGRLLLIGWSMPVHAVDSGVPEVVGAILARALTSIARVSFPVSEHDQVASREWGEPSVDDVRILSSGGLFERADAALKGEPAIVKLVSTCEARTALRIFEDSAYPWRLQGQVAVLSSLNSGPPDIDRKALLSLISDHWAEQCVQLRFRGIDAVIRPGVDGDILGVLSLTDEFTSRFLEAVEREAREAKFDWFLLTERDFSDTLARA
jgi:hypothetical protein